MTDIVMALRLRIEDDEAPLYDHELHRHALKAIQELRGKLQTVTEACTLMRRETDAEIEQLRNLVDQCDHHEHSLQEAHAEIERLRAKDQHWNEHLRTAQAEIERLTACLRWEQNWLERVGTHAPGCWQWGPGHYLCAVRHIEGLEHVATGPANPADHAQG